MCNTGTYVTAVEYSCELASHSSRQSAPGTAYAMLHGNPAVVVCYCYYIVYQTSPAWPVSLADTGMLQLATTCLSLRC